MKSKLQEILAWANKLSANGDLQRWAIIISKRLSEATDKAWEFATKTDWKAVAGDVKDVASGIWDLASAIAKVVHIAERLNSFGSSVDRATGFDNMNNSLEGKTWRFLNTPFADWFKGSPATPGVPHLALPAPRLGPPMATGRGGAGAHVPQVWRAPTTPTKQHVSLDINLRGDAAPRASVQRVSAAGPVSASVNRGRAMGGVA